MILFTEALQSFLRKASRKQLGKALIGGVFSIRVVGLQPGNLLKKYSVAHYFLRIFRNILEKLFCGKWMDTCFLTLFAVGWNGVFTCPMYSSDGKELAFALQASSLWLYSKLPGRNL